MAIPHDQPSPPGTSVVPPYNPARPYPVLEPTLEPIVIGRYDDMDKIPNDTYYTPYPSLPVPTGPTPGVLYGLSGPALGVIGSPSSNFTVILLSAELSGTATITPHDSGGGGTFTPSSVSITQGSPSATFTYTPASEGVKVITVTNDSGLINPTPLSFLAYSNIATTYNLYGPSFGNAHNASDPFTVEIPITGQIVTGTVHITPNDGGDGGVFTPSSVGITTVSSSATFTYTPASSGTKTINCTNDGGLANPTGLEYDSAPSGLNDGDSVSTWIDSSGEGHDGNGSGATRPVFKTNILNSLPIVRSNGPTINLVLASAITGVIPWTIWVVMKPSAASTDLLPIFTSHASGVPFGPITSSDGNCYAATRSHFTGGNATPFSGFHIYTAVSAQPSLYIDGVFNSGQLFAFPGSGDFDRLMKGGGDVAEIIVANLAYEDGSGTGNNAAQDSINQWLANKYGLTITNLTGSPPVDPVIAPGLVGWWKADSLLTPPPPIPNYTIIDTTVSGDATRILLPNSPVAGKAIVFCHGLQNVTPPLTGDQILNPHSGGLVRYIKGALDAGYLIAGGNFGGFGWSNATAQSKIENLVAYLVSNYSTNQVVMWGGSAGGPPSLLKATQGFPGVTVKGWHNIFPIVNLDSASHNPLLTASIAAAFPSYPSDAVGRDPILFPASAFNGLRLRCCESPDDTAAPKAIHGDALVALATGHATEVTCIATTGEHGDNSNYTQALADDFVAFLGRCFT